MVSETRKQYNINNRERMNEYMNEYYHKNIETMRANNRACYERKKLQVAKRRAMNKLENGERIKLKTLTEYFSPEEVEILRQKHQTQLLDWI